MAGSNARGIVQRLSLRLWTAFALASVVTYGLEITSERALEQTGDQSLLGQSVFGISRLYQGIVAAGPRRPVPRYTALVVINAATDPASVGLLNVCEQRGFLALLLQRIAYAAPTVIVVDKFFDASTNCDNGAGTASLQAAVRELTSARIPVVLGSLIEEQPVSISPQRPDGNPPTHLVVRDTLDFPGADRSLLTFGAVNLSPDTRKVPLQWSAYSRDRDVPSAAERVMIPTLAFQTARSFDPDLVDKYPRLRHLLAAHVHPYISFIDVPAFLTFGAGQVVCGMKTASAHSWRDCVHALPDPSVVHALHGRIVIIGERRRDMDIHSSVLGAVPGVLLQANYIEALLDDRYFEPVSRWVDYAYGFILFAGVQLAMLTYQKSLLRAMFWASACFAAAIFGLYVLVVHLGWYVNPVTVSLLAFAIYGSHLVFERLVALGGRRDESHSTSVRSAGDRIDGNRIPDDRVR